MTESNSPDPDPAPLSILIVDDDEVDREAARRYLKSAGLSVDVTEADIGAAAMDLLRRRRFDCIVLDHNLPDADSLSLLQQMRAEGMTTPVIVLTGSGDEILAVELMKAGVADYLTKRRVTAEALARSVRHAVRLNQAERWASRAEASLHATQERLRLLLDNVRDYAIIGLDPRGIIGEWSLGAENVFGFSGHEVIGRHFSLLFTPEDRAAGVPEQELDTAARTGYAPDERWHLRREKEPFYAAGTTTALRDAEGALRGFMKLVRDETQRQRQEIQLRQMNLELAAAKERAEEASRAKSEFLANLTHELRTPLNIVLNLTEFVEERLEENVDPEIMDDLGKIRLAGGHLLNLINDLLDIARIEANRMGLRPEQFDICHLIGETAELAKPLLQKQNNRLEVSCPDDIGPIHADRGRIRQVLLNLLSNAAKFTEDGVVRITCAREQGSNGEWIVISVSDTGIGISAHEMGQLFQKFHQADASPRRRHGGTGLGLALSKLLTEMMDGSISCQSELGKGSTFQVRLPAKGAQPLQVSVPTPRSTTAHTT